MTTLAEYRTDPQIAAEEFAKATLIKRGERWADAPEIPSSIQQSFDAYAQRYWLKLSLVWNGWTGCWSVMSEEKTLDLQSGEYRPRPTLLYVHADDATGEPLPLDNRLLDNLHERYTGETLEERMRAKQKARAEEQAAQKAHSRDSIAAAMENVERHMTEVNQTNRSVEDVLGLTPKPRSFGAFGAARSQRN